MSDPLEPDADVLVVGASLAGLRAAEEIRHEQHPGRVVVIGDEDHVPYDRPPLSKQLLAGTWDVDRIHHHAPDKLDTLGIEFRLGTRVVALDVAGRTAAFDDGTEVSFGGLVLTPGARARTMPGTEGIEAVHTLRTLEDSLSIREHVVELGANARVVVIGAGFIGSEVASTCSGLEAEVTVVEALPTPLARALGVEMGEACARLHRSHGVRLLTGVGVSAVVPGDPSAAGLPTATVELADGLRLEADVVVVGIGVVPETGWLEGSGLELDDGVVCSESLFAADRVVAAGDAARWPLASVGRTVRLEHWTNAAEGGAAAGRNLLAGSAAAVPYEPVPFFWSDQYGVKIQMLGLPDPDDEVTVVDGSPEEERMVAIYRRGDRLSGALAFSRARQLMAYRPLLAAGASFDEALAASAG
jgi:NADPH-dependent 2,4-dienoyl-CoA reductase/sulfur reductase-like enzyme